MPKERPTKPSVEASSSRGQWVDGRAFRSVVEATADAAGEEFFRSLVKHLAQALRVEYAFVAEFSTTPGRVSTVAYWGGSDWMDNVEYELSGTPCEEVVKGALCFRRCNVQDSFPKDDELRRLNCSSYLGVPLKSRHGDTMGHLAIMDVAPMQDDPKDLSMFRVFADRARVEFERVRIADELARACRDLTLSVEEKSRDLDQAYREIDALMSINQAIIRHLKHSDLFEAVGRAVGQVLPANRMVVFVPSLADRRVSVYALHGQGPSSKLHEGERIPPKGAAATWIYENQQVFRASCRDDIRDRFPVTYDELAVDDLQAVCGFPLMIGERCLGVVGLLASDRGAYDTVPDSLLEGIGQGVAVALDNCMAYEEVQRLRDRLSAENVYLQEEIRQQHEIVGGEGGLRQVFDEVRCIAPTKSTVLILGETGTGKELVARAIHAASPRSSRPLVKVNCSAISAGLVESELFGHVKGAFTGAIADRTGRFALADGGTIFLDEIGELAPDTQVKLLRVLQEREFEPVGSEKTQSVDVRVIAATNRDLERAVGEGRFRSDLFYRLNVLPLQIPPLRERREDIEPLIDVFVERFGREVGKTVGTLDATTLERLRSYDWPGNVRELQNVIERAVVLSRSGTLEIDPVALSHRFDARSRLPAQPVAEPAELPSLDEVERRHVQAALERCDGVIEGPGGAAKILGLHPNTLRGRMKRLGIQRRPPRLGRTRSHR